MSIPSRAASKSLRYRISEIRSVSGGPEDLGLFVSFLVVGLLCKTFFVAVIVDFFRVLLRKGRPKDTKAGGNSRVAN